MGIFGLSAFVFEHGTLGTQCTWSSDSQQDENDHFIIDGNAFTYHYAMKTNFNWVHGGKLPYKKTYKMFAETVRRDIAAMQRAGIRLTFLFDGALPHDKEYTRMKRYRSYIERAELILAHLDQINNNLRTQESGIQHAADMYLIPPLMLEVCLQTIRDLGLDPVVCQGEADGRVVRLADECQGYVVSKDSDMHVYPHIGKGYIPLNTLTIYSEVSDNSHSHSNSTVKGTVYHPRRLASLLQLNSVALLPVFGAILGNDYIDPQLVRYPIMEWCSSRNMPVKNKISYWPKCVAEYLRDMGSDLDLVGIADNLKALIGKAREYNTAATAAAVDGLEEALVSSVYRYDPESTLL
ncbi:PIN domain-like protein, partial [Zychaea mexicana]|uniref:PIN domain-like protein n=1 Tax=Zychaea mexicana TaxID=64656 RepID=UPI0022FE8611